VGQLVGLQVAWRVCGEAALVARVNHLPDAFSRVIIYQLIKVLNIKNYLSLLDEDVFWLCSIIT